MLKQKERRLSLPVSFLYGGVVFAVIYAVLSWLFDFVFRSAKHWDYYALDGVRMAAILIVYYFARLVYNRHINK